MGPGGESTQIKQDVPCAECGYNLQSIAFDAACPECGAAVAPSVEVWRRLGGNVLSHAQLIWIRRAAWLMILTVAIHTLLSQLYYFFWVFCLQFDWIAQMWRLSFRVILSRNVIDQCLFAVSMLVLIRACVPGSTNRRPWIALAAVIFCVASVTFDSVMPPQPLNTPLTVIQNIGYTGRALSPTLSCYLGLMCALLILRERWAKSNDTTLRRRLTLGVVGAFVYALGFTIAVLQWYWDWPVPWPAWPSLWDVNRRFFEPIGQLGILLAAYALYRRTGGLLAECWRLENKNGESGS